jgi:ribonucleoside-diphosphate reductase alpha chain
MRPQPRFAVLASAVRRAMREIERGGRLIEVLAPEDWSDARTEAWLDWAAEEGLPLDGDDLIVEAANAFAARQAPDEATAAELAATLRLGLATPARPQAVSAGDALILSDPAAARLLAAETARRRALRLAGGAVDAVASALAAVSEAVSRCEGPRGDCADPAINPALARAAMTARRAGAADADILRAVAGESFEAAPLPVRPAAPWTAVADRALVASGAPEALLAAEGALDGDLVLAFDPETAELTAEAARGAGVLISLTALRTLTGEGFEAALADLAALWTTALSDGGTLPVCVGLAELGDLVLTEGAGDPLARAAELAGTVAGSGPAGLFVDDREAMLRLGASPLTALDRFETADGEAVSRLRPALARLIEARGGDIEDAERHLLGRRTLAGAPGVDHAALRTHGFTDVELEGVELALARVERLEDAFRAPVLDAGFLRDVLGIEDAAEGDLLTRLGFTADDIAAATAWAFGHGDLAGWTGAPEGLTAVLADLSGFETGLRGALEPFSGAPDLTPVPLPWNATPGPGRAGAGRRRARRPPGRAPAPRRAARRAVAGPARKRKPGPRTPPRARGPQRRAGDREGHRARPHPPQTA